jgi:inositol phosphorylceramide mannosyltransferase catalytic subunit
MIPRVLHQIWVGPHQLPEEFAAYADTWRRHHPGWEYRLWTEAEIPPDLRRPEARERLRMPAERSDILRVEILWREGGVYVDTDFECRGSLEPHLDSREFVTASLFPHRVNNAFIASVPGHVILDEALAEMKPREFFGFDKWAAGPFFFNSIVQRHKSSPGVHLLPPELMYPRTLAQRERALAIHHVARSWKNVDELHDDLLRAERTLREVQGRLEQELRAHAETKRRLELAERRASATPPGRSRERAP